MTPPSRLIIGTADDPGWQQLLESQPEATAFHHPAWSAVLADSYGYRPLTILQTDALGAVTAGIPLVEVKGTLGGHRYVALPFTDHCPPIGTTAANLVRLTGDLLNWRDTVGAKGIAVHGALAAGPRVHTVMRGVRHILTLGRSSEQVFASLRSPVRGFVRKAQRLGVEARRTQSPADLETFYRLHLQTRRRLGVPVQPRRFIEALWKRVIEPGLGFVVLAYREERPIAAALFLAWNGNLIYKFGASDPRYWELRPNNLVIWAAIDWACQQGYRSLDFGRSDLNNQGLRYFKSSWGSTEVPLIYSHVGAAPSGSVPRLPMWTLTRLIRSSPPVVCQALGELLYGRVQSLA